jgi:uridine kinase
MPYVVAIAGAAGAGKSSLVREMLQIFPESSAIFIDDYQRITREPVQNLSLWMEEGADFDQLNIPVLGDHLARLKQGESVTEPVRLTPIEARKYILFETHFGRAHKETGKHIDLLVWLDTPADVALARNIRGLLAPMHPGGGVVPSAERIAALSGYLGKYLDNIRPLLTVQVERVSADADVRLDGSLDAHENAVRLRDTIMERLP